jgi:peptidoglycan/xylan/chitin deacetylase (PgdA/CDA1 family)
MHKGAKNLLYILIFILISVNLVLITSSGQEELKKIPVLTYHNIVQELEDEDPWLNVTPGQFRLHLQTLKEEGYETITFSDYYRYVTEDFPLPDKPIIINFDDGYLSNYEYGFPILKEMNMKATIFIVTSTVGANYDWMFPHFTWQQALQMEQSGLVDIQSHTHTHSNIAQINNADMIKELRLSKYLIETNLNKECEFLAYPYGLFSEKSLYQAEAAGYKMQMLFENTGVNTKNTPLNQVKRLAVRGDFTKKELIDFIEEMMEKTD